MLYADIISSPLLALLKFDETLLHLNHIQNITPNMYLFQCFVICHETEIFLRVMSKLCSN